jgi:hypothetical protein
LQPCHCFCEHGFGANIDDPIKDRGLRAIVWMTARRRLLAGRPFAEMTKGRGCDIMWKKERDLLLSQTMAFVQSVAAKAADVDGRLEARLPSVSSDQPFAVERPIDMLPARLSPLGQTDLRDEIRRRVAAFRVRQQAFDRDRNAYCNAMMAKARASSEEAVKWRDNQPLKR